MASDTAPTDLGQFEGATVVRSTIALRNAGDGLSEALQVDPALLHIGDTVYVVMETRVSSIEFPELSPDTPNLVERKAVLRAGTALLADDDLVGGMIDKQKERVQARRAADRLAREQEAKAKPGGQQTIVGPDGEIDPDAVIGDGPPPAKKAPAKKAAAKKAAAKKKAPAKKAGSPPLSVVR